MDEPLEESHLIQISNRFTEDGIVEFAKMFLKLTTIDIMNATFSTTTSWVFKWKALITWRNKGEHARRQILELFVIIDKLSCGAGRCSCAGQSSRDAVLDILKANNMKDDLNDDVLLGVAKFLTNEHLDQILKQVKLSNAELESSVSHKKVHSQEDLSLTQQCLKILDMWWKQNKHCTVLSLYVLLWQAEKYSQRHRIVKRKTARTLYIYAVGASNASANALGREHKAELRRWRNILRKVSEAGMTLFCLPHDHIFLSVGAKVCTEVTTTLDKLEKTLRDHNREPLEIYEAEPDVEQLRPLQAAAQASSGTDSQDSSPTESWNSSTQDSFRALSRGLMLFYGLLRALMRTPQDVQLESVYDEVSGKPLMQVNLKNHRFYLILEEKATLARFENRRRIRMQEETTIENEVEKHLRKKYKKQPLLSGRDRQNEHRHERHYIPRVLRQITFSCGRRLSASGKEIHESSLMHDMHERTTECRMLVQAASGSGKSTLWKHIAQRWAYKDLDYFKITDYKYVIFIDGNRMKKGDTVCGYIKRELLCSLDISEKRLKELLKKYESNILWLIDGIDRIKRNAPQPKNTEETDSRGFMSLLEGHYLPDSALIMTGYPNSTGVLNINSNREPLQTYELLPFQYPDIKRFIETLPDVVQKRCLKLGLTKHELESLMETPLFLWLVVRLCESENDKRIESLTKSLLTKEFIDEMVKNLQYNHLQKKAYICFKMNTDYFSSSKLMAMKSFIDTDASILSPYQPHLELSPHAYYRFESTMIQSFLAAQYIFRSQRLCKIETRLANLKRRMRHNKQEFMYILSFVVGLLSMREAERPPGVFLPKIKLQICRRVCANLITAHCPSLLKNDDLHEAHDIFSCLAEAMPIVDEQFCRRIDKRLCTQLWYNQVLCKSCCARAMMMLVEHGGCTVYINGNHMKDLQKIQEEFSKLTVSSRREDVVNMDTLNRKLGPNGVYNGVYTDRITVKDCPEKLPRVGNNVNSLELTVDNSHPLLAEQLIREMTGLKTLQLHNMTKSSKLKMGVVRALLKYNSNIREVTLQDKSFPVQRSLAQKINKLKQLRALSYNTVDSDNSPDQDAKVLDTLLTTCTHALDKFEFTPKHCSALKNIVNIVQKMRQVVWKRIRFVGDSILELVDLILQCTRAGRCTSLFTAKKARGSIKPSALLIVGHGASVSEAWEELLASGTDLAIADLHCYDMDTLVQLLNYGREEMKKETQKLQIAKLRIHLTRKPRVGDYKRYDLFTSMPLTCPDVHVRGSMKSSVEVRAAFKAGNWTVNDVPNMNRESTRL